MGTSGWPSKTRCSNCKAACSSASQALSPCAGGFAFRSDHPSPRNQSANRSFDGCAPLCLVTILANVHQDRRELSLSAAVAIVTGQSVALGIFLTPASMARLLGSPLLLALVWCGLGLMALSGALCYTELAVRYPASGGEYVYLRHGFGDTAA